MIPIWVSMNLDTIHWAPRQSLSAQDAGGGRVSAMEQWVTDNPWPTAMITLAAIGALVAVVKAGIRIVQWVGAVNSDRKSFAAFMEEVRDDIKQILLRLPPPTSAPGSPLQLTEFGEHISRGLGVEDWARGQAAALLGEAEGKEPYEVHDFCADFVQAQFDLGDEFYVRVRAGAYENGTNVPGVLDVFTIELREALLGLMGEQR